MVDTVGDDYKARDLKRYWTKGKGLAKWATNPHPYTTLVTLLSKYMTPGQAKGLAANYFKAVFGHWPGHRKGSNPVGPG